MNTEPQVNIQDNTAQILDTFKTILATEVPAEHLAKVMDNILWEVTRYRLTDGDYTGFSEGADDLYYIRLLARTFSGQPVR